MAADADLLASAQRLHRERHIAEAEAAYRRVLAAEPGHPEALRGLGIIEFESGRYQAAEETTQRLLAVRPRDPAVHVGLGLVLWRQNRPDEAIAQFQAALAIDPFHLGALINLSDLWRAQGRVEDAIMGAHRAVSVDPENADACNLMGAALQSAGQPEAALEWIERAAVSRPADARIQYNLGVVLQDMTRLDEAIAAYRRALGLDPQLMEAHNNIGLLLVQRRQSAAAIEHLRRAVALCPTMAAPHNSLGKALYDAGRLDDALASFQQALVIDPAHAESLANIGGIQRALGRLEPALASLDRAVALRPGLADAHANRGIVLRDLGRLDEAHDSLRHAVQLRPEEPELHLALALSHNDRAEHPDALASADRAVKLAPDSANIHRRVLGLLLYQPGGDSADRFARSRAFGARFGSRQAAVPDFAGRSADPARRLRVGYLSSDLRGDHPVARNVEPLFAHHDRQRFEIFVYADIAAPDETTGRFRALSDGWRSVVGMGDQDVAAAVHEDQIDILVSLAGRFDRNRPLVAAYRPAPVQVSFHDPATSGLVEMDYLISDRVLSPRHAPERFSERVLRLPHFYIHPPLDTAPAVGPLPMLATDHPTFGCFNNPAKLSADCLALWAQLLEAVPGARLRLKFRDWYRSVPLGRRIEGIFAAAGISPDRLSIVDRDPPQGHHLEMYNQVDVALDPFPFTGSTTTFEALSMGVPVVTLCGDAMVSRWSASILDAVGLSHLAATDRRGYIAAAVALVSDPARLAGLRADLRRRVAASPLCDGRGRTRQIERLYRAMWRRSCPRSR
ncbi:MAG TPA: tetratricopeptide repeat protein [Alphaproteobacteria bacterium]